MQAVVPMKCQHVAHGVLHSGLPRSALARAALPGADRCTHRAGRPLLRRGLHLRSARLPPALGRQTCGRKQGQAARAAAGDDEEMPLRVRRATVEAEPAAAAAAEEAPAEAEVGVSRPADSAESPASTSGAL